MCSLSKDIHEGAVQYFQAFLSRQTIKDVSDLSNLITVEVTTEENADLVQDPSKAKLKMILLSIWKDSNLGPDSFGSRFT